MVKIVFPAIVALSIDLLLTVMGIGPVEIFGDLLTELKNSPIYLTSGPFAAGQHMAFDFGLIFLPLLGIMMITEHIIEIFRTK